MISSPLRPLVVAGGFSPLSVSGLKLWLKADSGLYQERTGASATTPASADGDPVGTWLDRSGQANHLTTTADSKRPSLKLAIQNGRPAVLSDGVDDQLISASFTHFSSKRGTCFLVWKRVSGNICAFATFNGTAPNYQAQASGVAYKWYDGSAAAILETTTTSGSTHVLVYNRTGDTTLNFRRNGTDKGAATIANNQPAANTLSFAGDAGGVGEYASAYYMEFLEYDTSLSPTGVANVEAYLNSRWGAY